MIFAGLPLLAANATRTVPVLPGYLSVTIGLAREQRTIERSLIPRLTLWTLIAAALVGAQPWTIAIILMITLGLRIKLRETQ